MPFCAISPPEDCSANGTCASVDATADAAPDAAPIVIANAPDAGTDAKGAPDATRATDADARAPVDAHAPVETSVSETKANLDASEAGVDVIEEPPPPVCDPTKEPSQDPCVIDEAYGVFVGNVFVTANEVDGESVPTDSSVALLGPGDGSKLNPYATIREALAGLHGKSRIYVCNDVYSEAVTITTPVAIFGGLSCTLDRQSFAISWAYVGGAPRVVGSSPALTVRGAGAVTAEGGTDASPSDAAPSASPALAVTIEDMTFSSPDAIGAGASSIAAWVDTANVNFVRVTLAAGRGADGAAGANGDAAPNYTGPAPVGGNQDFEPLGVSTAGVGGVNQCLLSGMSAGGTGGIGCNVRGSAGIATPMPPTTPGFDGLPFETFLADGGLVTENDPGADGVALASPDELLQHGIAAPAGDYGSLLASGWVPSGGSKGITGGPGQGGAGATDPLFDFCRADSVSAGGGGGGAGGCGGSGGQGGSGGGASIALASLNSTVTFTQSVLAVSNGGSGGAGGNGQDGQAGAMGGNINPPDAVSAAGASGGNGAGGSGGGGGTGGLAVGILFSNSTITRDDTTDRNWTPTAPRAGGAGGLPGLHAGSSGMDGNPGAAGLNGTSAIILETN